MIRIPNENVPGVVPYFPVKPIIKVTSKEKIRKVMCETGFRRLSTLWSAGVFIPTNLMIPY
jgi:hypothetical protein